MGIPEHSKPDQIEEAIACFSDVTATLVFLTRLGLQNLLGLCSCDTIRGIVL